MIKLVFFQERDKNEGVDEMGLKNRSCYFYGIFYIQCGLSIKFVARQYANITTRITTCKYSFLWLIIELNYYCRGGGHGRSHDVFLASDWTM